MNEWEEGLIVLPFLAAGIYALFAHFTGNVKPRLIAITCYCIALSLFVAALHFQPVDPPSLTIFYIICAAGLTFWGARIQGKSD